jgi:hypothetical protein
MGNLYPQQGEGSLGQASDRLVVTGASTAVAMGTIGRRLAGCRGIQRIQGKKRCTRCVLLCTGIQEESEVRVERGQCHAHLGKATLRASATRHGAAVCSHRRRFVSLV